MDVCIDFLWKEPGSIAMNSPTCKAACERFGNNLRAEKTELPRFPGHLPSIGPDRSVSSGILQHFCISGSDRGGLFTIEFDLHLAR